MNITGFNHLTINVSSLEESLTFYMEILQAVLVHKGRMDAYLEWGPIWICLQEKDSLGTSRGYGVDHIAFSINEEEFFKAVQRLKEKEVCIVRGPLRRGKGWSVNFLATDNIQFELHTSNLQERMEDWY
ncbi:VOC family protein [uncultured Rossellomorea sp.]|uniref:VOC family protein n=1 Tax=uncultured Rossellomorea sp. TaxID=2837549 RepID=UPI002636EBC0|nr:VOC family protein [uncultured Rossellomorea sp.]